MLNAYGAIILLALLGSWALQLVADLLNIKALRPEPPQRLADLYDRERYARSQTYTRTLTRFGLVRSAFDLALLAAFWFAGGFDWVGGWAAGWGRGAVVTGLLFLGALFLVRFLIGIPFAVYATFVIEARFGFNRTTPATFVKDRLKGLILSLLLGIPLLAAVLAFFNHAGEWAWVWCWGAVTLFSLALTYVAPTWIMPLFNKFTPLEEGELREAILGYTAKVGFPLRGLFVIDGSRRSAKANAFFTGFGKNRRIALYDTLIAEHPPAELVAVVAHEVGHYKLGHIRKGLIMGIAHTGLLFWLLSLFLATPGLHEAFAMREITVHGGLVFFGMLYTPIELVLGLVTGALSRRHEHQADAFAAETTAAPAALVEGLKRLSVKNLANLTPHPFYVFLNYSHPPLLSRIETIESHAGQTPDH